MGVPPFLPHQYCCCGTTLSFLRSSRGNIDLLVRISWVTTPYTVHPFPKQVSIASWALWDIKYSQFDISKMAKRLFSLCAGKKYPAKYTFSLYTSQSSRFLRLHLPPGMLIHDLTLPHSWNFCIAVCGQVHFSLCLSYPSKCIVRFPWKR